MPRPFDPLTKLGNAVCALLAADSFISSYGWAPFENNSAANLPRGYVNVMAQSSMHEAWLPDQFEVEIVIEGKPKQITDPEKISTVLGHVTRPDLAAALTALMTDGSLTIFGKAENLRLAQSIVGEMRQYKMTFNLFGQWNVEWVAD